MAVKKISINDFGRINILNPKFTGSFHQVTLVVFTLPVMARVSL